MSILSYKRAALRRAIAVLIGAALCALALARLAPGGSTKASALPGAVVTPDQIVSADQGAPAASLTAPPISTTGQDEVLVAFVATDGPVGVSRFASVSGGGLQWNVVARANSQPGSAEIWQAWAATPVANVAVTAARANGAYVGSITVAAFKGARKTTVGVSRSTATGAPAVATATHAIGAVLYAVGDDWDRAAARAPLAGQEVVHADLSPTNDTYWVQRTTTPATAAGAAVTVGDSAPTGDRSNLAAIEIDPIPLTTSPPPTTAPATTVPATTVPPTTVAPTTVAPTTVPATTVPPTTAPPKTTPSTLKGAGAPTTTTVPPTTTPTTAPPATPPPSGGVVDAPSPVPLPAGWPAPRPAWPGPSNTGVPAGTVLRAPVSTDPGYLTSGGDVVVTQSGAVINGLDIQGQLYIAANGVVVQDTRVRDGADMTPVVVDKSVTQAPIIMDTEVSGLGSAACEETVGYSDFYLLHVNLHDCGDGVRDNGNVVVQDSWIHDLNGASNAHNDGIQMTEGSNVWIVHNMVSNPQDQTSCIQVGADQGPISNVVEEDNLVNGGGYSLYGGEGGAYSVSNIQILNNRILHRPEAGAFFANGGYWGPATAMTSPAITYRGTVWDDTGAAV